MKQRKKTKKSDSATTARRGPALVALALVVLAIGAISAVSRQLVAGKETAQPENSDSGKKYMTVKVAGQDVQVDTQTGKLKPLNAQQAQELAAGLKKMLNKSADGLTEVQHEDGSVTMDFQGRFRHAIIARAKEDGGVSMSCVDTPQAAAAVLEIDPKLFDIENAPAKPQARQRN